MIKMNKDNECNSTITTTAAVPSIADTTFQQIQSSAKLQRNHTHSPVTPSSAVSFFHRINPFGNKIHAHSEKCSECLANNKKQSIDDIKSVQSLKQFWISAFGGSGSSNGINCTCETKSQQYLSKLDPRAKCLSLDRNVNLLGDSDLRRNASSSSPFRKSSIDNFYKYKTADLVKNNRISDIHSQCSDRSKDMKTKLMPSSSSSSVEPSTKSDVNDSHHKEMNDENANKFEIPAAEISEENEMIVFAAENNEILILNDKEILGKEIANTTTMANDKTCVDSAAYKTPATDKITTTSNASKSTTSSTSSLASESPRKQNTTTRKCSFRTNSFHHHHHHHHHKKMTSSTSTVGGSKVAALTHRFNQLIQQDAEILEEVRKNKEMIIHRLGGHVFKIKEETDGRKRTPTKKSDNGGDSSAVSSQVKLVKKKPSVKRKASIKSGRPGAVKATIEIFEPEDKSKILTEHDLKTIESSVPKPEKPKVPDKSAEVLQRTKEIVVLNSLKRIKTGNGSILRPNVEIKDKEEKNAIKEKRKTLENIKEEKEEKPELNHSTIDSSIMETNTLPKSVDELPQILETENKPTKSQLESEQILESECDSKCKKSKYFRLYEKLKFKTSFTSRNKTLNNKTSMDANPEPIYSLPEQKIINAICSVNQRIEELSKSENCLIASPDENTMKESRISDNEVDEHNMKPNTSFLFRSTYKPIFNSSYEISTEDRHPVEAINPLVMCKTRSMDEASFPSNQQRLLHQVSLEEKNFSAICKRTDDLLLKLRDHLNQEEDDYEVIKPYDDLDKEDKPCVEPSEIKEQPIESFVHKDYQKIHFVKPQQDHIDDEKISSHDSSSIYQSISEAISSKNSNKDCDSLNSYESFENYEAVDELLPNIKNENGYEICDPPGPPPEPPPPRKSSDSELRIQKEPQLPIPKRNFVASQPHLLQSDETFSTTYEKIKYDVAPPIRPPKSPNPKAKVDNSNIVVNNRSDCRSIYSYRSYAYEENIYDTIKTADSTSMATDYESINSATNFLRIDRGMKHSDSMSTLSSDIKTNSLYGTTIGGGGGGVGGCGRGVTPPSEGGSDNSDEWIDISDDEGQKKHTFVVICERKKCHRSPSDWSRKIRDKRLNKEDQETYEDDSDHYYETLDTAENTKTPGSANSTHSHSTIVGNENLLDHIETIIHDDFDSFDSDDETDEDIRKNDSGVDVSNTRLPDPPTQLSQVYSFMQKIKNFGSISKSLTKLTKRKTSSTSFMATDDLNVQKQKYENTQFYVQNDYQNVEPKPRSKSKTKTPKMTKKKETPADPYENTEFHSPRTTLIMPSQNTQPSDTLSASSPVLSHFDKNSIGKSESTDILSRKKSKSGKSFKSKFRKTLSSDTSINLGSSFNGNRSTFYVSDSIDVDSGIFSSTDKVPTTDDLHLSDTLSHKPKITEDLSQTSNLVTLRNSKNSTSPEVNRRRSSLGIRPNNPPPPPPVDNKKYYKSKRLGTTSWYAECGVFKSNTLNESQIDGLKSGRKDGKSTSSWYADSGLYQTSGASVASSSGSSGVSTGGECGPGDDSSHSMFLNEPLYQIYSQAKLESLTKDIEMEHEHSDGYEEIGGSQQPREEEKKQLRPSALQLVGPKQGPSRTLWSEIPEVINSQILSTLTPTEKRLQEAKFEILTSEASYLKSLTLLRTHFMNHPAFRDTSILNSSDRKTLFSYIVSVQECSDRLLCDLENCWQDNIMLLGLSHSVYKHAEKYFQVYVTYCEHQGKLDRTLKRLKDTKVTFCQALEALETDPVCCGLSLHSFLMLPMQRITRLPLLVDAVLSKLKLDDDEFDNWKMTLAILNKTVSQCNDAANRCEQAYELEILSRQIEFPSNIRPLPILPFGVPAPGTVPRSLVRRGDLIHLIWRGDDGKLTFGKKFTKTNIYAFLFTDLIVLTKKRSDEAFTVFDYCQRSLLTVSSGDIIPQLPAKELVCGGKHLILMTLLENHEGKMVELILSCPSETERQRWLHATEPPESENPDEKLYEQWDCPQVIAKHEYSGIQPDELTLDPGDVVNVTRKMADGWYHGERIRDGAQGWFPGNYTEEVASTHVRARNLKQRYRFLTFTAAYWESQKKK